MYERLVRWLELLAENQFDVFYKSGNSNLLAEFLSRMKPDNDTKPKVTATVESTEDPKYKKELIEMLNLRKGIDTKNFLKELIIWVRKNLKHFTFWKSSMFCRSAYDLRTIALIKSSVTLPQTFHIDIGTWDVETAKQCILERFLGQSAKK